MLLLMTIVAFAILIAILWGAWAFVSRRATRSDDD